ncbi:hypothetical protein L0F63_002324, partial [Massospora cicadina]
MPGGRGIKDYMFGENPFTPIKINFGPPASPVETCLLSQLKPKRADDFGSPGDDKICSGLSSLAFPNSSLDYGPAAPELSPSPSDSLLSQATQLKPIRIRSNTVQYKASSRQPDSEAGLRRAKSVAAAYPHLKPSRRSSRNSFNQITSSSYSSLPSSAAVSFLSSFADGCELDKVAPDEEGEEVGNYIMGRVIAHGAFSTVREAYTMDPRDGSLVKLAVKVIRKDSAVEQNMARLLELETEVMLWKQLRHPNLLRFVELVDTEYAEFVFMELCPNGSLLDHVLAKGKLDEVEARHSFRQLAGAVRYLHEDAHLVHCDLKLENIVRAEDNSLRLSDFGLSQSQRRPSTPTQATPKGSLAYCSPELLAAKGVNSYASDIWSLGVILYAMVSGQFPFSDGFEPRLVMKIRSGNFTTPSTLTSPLRNLLKSMLCPDPLLRPTIQEVLEHP